MERKEFIKSVVMGAIGITTLPAFKNFTDALQEQEQLMPVLFVGHR